MAVAKALEGRKTTASRPQAVSTSMENVASPSVYDVVSETVEAGNATSRIAIEVRLTILAKPRENVVLGAMAAERQGAVPPYSALAKLVRLGLLPEETPASIAAAASPEVGLARPI